LRESNRSESQPLPVVPIRSKIPITASRPAARTSGMPWSMHAGTRCVPTSPLVVAPQTKKLPASSQKSGLPALSRSTRSALASGCWREGTKAGMSGGAPYGSRPRSEGRSRTSSATSGKSSASTEATSSVTVRQPCVSTICASSGRKSIWPVAVLAVSTPITVPRRETNQRLTTVAPSTIAVVPVPSPTRIPQLTTSCQLERICEVSATPAQIRARETSTVRRMPNRSIKAAANGPTSP